MRAMSKNWGNQIQSGRSDPFAHYIYFYTQGSKECKSPYLQDGKFGTVMLAW